MTHPTDKQPSRHSVLAIDNIALDLPLAGVGSRILAGSIDLLLVTVVGGLLLIILAMGLNLIGLSGGWVIVVLVLAQFFLQTSYFALFEIATRGQTPGKRALRLRTVGSSGGTPTTGAFVIRNLVRVVDIMIGVPAMAIDSQSRRLGDHLAGTLVVHEERPEEEVTLGEVPAQWSARQVALVESYLRRADELEASQRDAIGRRLVAMVQRDAPHLLDGETATAMEYAPAAVLRRALIVIRDD